RSTSTCPSSPSPAPGPAMPSSSTHKDYGPPSNLEFRYRDQGFGGLGQQGHTAAGTVLTVWGRTRTRRALLVVLWPEQDSLDSYITAARELTADEEAELQRWEATR